MNKNPSKSAIHQACLNELKKKKEGLKTLIRDAQQAASEDTKSSAGDKYETSREMMKQEIQKAQQQLAIYEKMEEVMMKVKVDKAKEEVALGSLIQTNEGWYYFSVSLGQIEVEGKKVYVLSMASPLGQAMMKAHTGDSIIFRNRSIKIKSIA